MVGISGASGAIYGLRLLERLRLAGGIETHLILTRGGEKTAYLETGVLAKQIRDLADHSYPLEDIGSRLASGSFQTDGMVIAPCSIHSMSAIAAGISSNLMIRAADVTLKERRRLVLLVRETPFHLGHLRTMVSLAEMGQRAEADGAVDRELDERMVRLARQEPNLIMEGRLSGWMALRQGLPALKVWCHAPLEVRAGRVGLRDSQTTEQAVRDIGVREHSEHQRYARHHQIDLDDLSIYDLVLDTVALASEQVVEQILAALEDAG